MSAELTGPEQKAESEVFLDILKCDWRAVAVYTHLMDGLSYEEWAPIGKRLATMQNSTHWLLGYWLSFGEEKYGEKYSQAASETGISPERLMILKYVFSRFPFSRQRHELTWSHHLVVAGLEAVPADKWLAKAVKGDWSVAELRERLKDSKALPEPPVEKGDPLAGAPVKDLTNIARLTKELVDLAAKETKRASRIKTKLRALLKQPKVKKWLTVKVKDKSEVSHGKKAKKAR